MLRARVEHDLRAAIKSKDEPMKFTLRTIKSAILYREVELKIHKRPVLTDDQVRDVIRALVQQTEDAETQWLQVDRHEQAERCRLELEIMRRYLDES